MGVRMPRVVTEQAAALRRDAFLSRVLQPATVRFSEAPHAPLHERMLFLDNAVAAHSLQLTFPAFGINLHLRLSRVHTMESEVEFESRLIFNGVCIRVTGRLSRRSLEGTAKVELDEEAAAREVAALEVDAASEEALRRVTLALNLPPTN